MKVNLTEDFMAIINLPEQFQDKDSDFQPFFKILSNNNIKYRVLYSNDPGNYSNNVFISRVIYFI